MPSNYFSRLSGVFRLGVHRSTLRQEGGLLDSLDVIDARAKSLIGNSRLFSCVTSSIDPDVLLRQGTVAVQPNLHLVNRRENISFVGTLSHTFSTLPVSGPAFQITGYQVHCLQSEASKFCSSINTEKAPMPVFYSSAFPSNCSLSNLTSRCGGLRKIVTYPSTSFSKRRFGGCKKTSMDLTTKTSNKFSIYDCFVYNVAKTKGNSNPSSWFGLKDFHTSSQASFSAGAAHDTSFDNPTHEKQLLSSADSVDSSEQKIPVERTLKLHSGSCYLPHPDKEETGGEDAHFICADEQAIGVADGVGGWADLGVDAGHYARELMSHSVTAVQEEPKGSIDPARVLEKAYLRTKAKGSSTACVIALTDLGLRAINLGDSGFMVVRDGSTVFRSPIQQHDFNFTYQLESGNSGDLPSSGQVFTIPVVSGDVVIAGTDGLFDNLYNNDITSVVVHAVRAGFGPQVTAQKIAALARQRAQDKNRQTPFSTAAQEAGFRYYGGKLDDITVVVSFITSYNDKHHSDKMLVG